MFKFWKSKKKPEDELTEEAAEEPATELLLEKAVTPGNSHFPPLVISDTVSIADLISIYRMLESAYATFNGAEIAFGNENCGIRAALAREERTSVAMRLDALADEIRNANARTPAERRQKLRFEIMQAGDNEEMFNEAIDRYHAAEPKGSERLAEEDRRAMRSIADELYLAELALRMLSRTEEKYEAVRLLVDRAAQRIDAFGTQNEKSDTDSENENPWGPYLTADRAA